jgi:hypothetical protein
MLEGDRHVENLDTDKDKNRSNRELTLEEVFGSIPALPGVETGDFDDLIEQAMEQHAACVGDRMRRGLE